MNGLEIIDAEDLLSRPLRPPMFVVDSLIPQGATIISGSGKIG